MRSFHRFAGQGSIQLALALVAVGTWVSGCGDDETAKGGGKGGSSGAAGASGAAGSTTAGSGGTTAGSGGTAAGNAGNAGVGGTPVAGSGGTAGNAGSAGGGMGGVGEGGEGGMGEGGMSGTAGTAGMGGAGGEGGSTEQTCANNALSFDELDPMQAHDHLPVLGMDRTTFVTMVNAGTPLVFTMPEEGTNPHTHTLTFTAGQLTTLRNGGTIASITSSMGGPAANMHTHSYTIECGP
jgi:hypothetical protein